MAAWANRLALVVGFLAVAFMAMIKWLGTDTIGNESITYLSKGWMREGADWDPEQNRVIVSWLEGGLAEIRVNKSNPDAILREKLVVADPDFEGHSTLGLTVDSLRNRVLVAIGEPAKKRFSALAAYDLHSWERLFFAVLTGPEKESFADDVAVDKDGNAYVTDCAKNQLWKVSSDGSEVTVITNQKFKNLTSTLPFDLVGLNGIQYHPDGYLLVGHTWAGVILRSSLDGTSVHEVKLEGGITMPDGIVLVSPQKLAVVTAFSCYLLESFDGWETAKIIDTYTGPLHRMATAAFLKDGKVYINFAIGYGLKEKLFTIRESFKNLY